MNESCHMHDNKSRLKTIQKSRQSARLTRLTTEQVCRWNVSVCDTFHLTHSRLDTRWIIRHTSSVSLRHIPVCDTLHVTHSSLMECVADWRNVSQNNERCHRMCQSATHSSLRHIPCESATHPMCSRVSLRHLVLCQSANVWVYRLRLAHSHIQVLDCRLRQQPSLSRVYLVSLSSESA